MSNSKTTVYAVYQDPKEYCKPCFTTIQSASKPQFLQRTIYIPVFYDQLLMFAVQIESDAPQPNTTTTSVNGGASQSPPPRSPVRPHPGKQSRNNDRTTGRGTMSVRSRQISSKHSDGQSNNESRFVR